MEDYSRYSHSFSQDSLRHLSYEDRGRGSEDRGRRLQRENEYLCERLKSCEKGMSALYQLLHMQDKPVSPPRVLTQHRSASQVFRQQQGYSPSSKLDYSNRGDDVGSRQVTIPELRDAIQQIVRERNELLSELEDLKHVTEAAKRERVLAIDEKDKLLHGSHLLKVALERKDCALREVEGERDELSDRCRQLETEVLSLRKASEEARRTRSLALEERAKVMEERNQLQLEVAELLSKRDQLFEEKVQLQSSLQDVMTEKRRSQQKAERLSSHCAKYEAIARSLKEQNEVLNDRELERLTVAMTRTSTAQPWGFSIEGGQNSEFFHHDPSIVVTGIADSTPADSVLRFGDRILSVEGRDFRSVTRKEAAELLRSCDELSITMEISRSVSRLKPRPLEVKIPGKKAFGFDYESRLFVVSVEEGCAAADWLLPGDEIIQVMGKPAANMKPSHFKQVLKSCKDGITMTIHRLPGNREDKSKEEHNLTCSGSYQQKPSSEFFQSYQAPGTPGSTISESSAGYHSAHSLYSTVVSPVGEEAKTGQTGLTGLEVEPLPTSVRVNSRSSSSQFSQQSGYETDQTGLTSLELLPTHRYRACSTGSGGFSRSSLRSHQPEFYSGRPTYTSLQRSGYRTGHTGLTTPKSDAPNVWYPRGASVSSRPYGRNAHFSASYDHLDTEHFPQRERARSRDRSLDDHVTVVVPKHPRQALSLSNMNSSNPKHTHL